MSPLPHRPRRLSVATTTAALLLLGGQLSLLHATYSIVACDKATRQCGVAVQTDNLAVGASVPAAQAGVGAIASQFETHPRHGRRALELLAQGRPPAEALATLLAEDGGFDGNGIEARQVGVVAVDGRTAVHTGRTAAQSTWAGAVSGDGYSIQGNGLAGAGVVEAMARSFRDARGPLADRLMAALRAGDRAGGQRTGRQSAALLVRTVEGFPFDVDLRVDDEANPVAALSRLHDRHAARQQIIDARRAGRRDAGRAPLLQLDAGVARAHGWPRALVLAAEAAIELESPARALAYLQRARAVDPGRVSAAIGRGTFARLGSTAGFAGLVTPATRRAALDARRSLAEPARAAADVRIGIAARLLEVGAAAAALEVVEGVAGAPDAVLVRASALEALGRHRAAIDACRAGARARPDDVRLQRRLRSLESGP
jgi:uncharacterized Ntn-hydrolase superfamily protein